MAILVTDLFDIYDATAKLTGHHAEMAADFATVQRQFEDKRQQPSANIMIYGVYNAGKSTLINALIGDNVAKTGDIPLTDSVDRYIWNNTTILDTPGVDAPLEHELVTREQMLKSDAIIFVVNPSGAAEEEKTLQVLIEILQAKKKLFLVLNDKDNMSVDDLLRLKNDIRIRLQILAENKGMHDILQDIPIFRINAQMALTAKLKNKPNLLIKSELPIVEDALKIFIASVDNQHIYRRLASELHGFIARFLNTLDANTTNETLRGYDSLLRKMVEQQYVCRKTILAEITRQRDVMYRGSKAAFLQHSDKSEETIEQLFHKASDNIEAVQKRESEYLVQCFQEDINNLQAAILHQAELSKPQNTPCKPQEQQLANIDSAEESNFNAEMLNQAFSSFTSLAKPEYVVSGLQLVKDWIPSLMKGIGPKTMEKWGAVVVGKWIPYVGPIVTMLSSLWDFSAQNDENKKLQEENAQRRHEWERYQQQVDDSAKDIANKFESNTTQLVNETLDVWFKELRDKIEQARDMASEQDQALSSHIMQLQEFSSQLNSLL